MSQWPSDVSVALFALVCLYFLTKHCWSRAIGPYKPNRAAKPTRKKNKLNIQPQRSTSFSRFCDSLSDFADSLRFLVSAWRRSRLAFINTVYAYACLAVVCFSGVFITYLLLCAQSRLEDITPLGVINYQIRIKNPRTDFLYDYVYPCFLDLFEWWHGWHLDNLELDLDPKDRKSKDIDHTIWTGRRPRWDKRVALWQSGYRPWNQGDAAICKDLFMGNYSFCNWACAKMPKWVIGLWTLIFWWYKPYW